LYKGIFKISKDTLSWRLVPGASGKRSLKLKETLKQIKGLFEATTILHDEVHASV